MGENGSDSRRLSAGDARNQKNMSAKSARIRGSTDNLRPLIREPVWSAVTATG
jgi:hypothetical protein